MSAEEIAQAIREAKAKAWDEGVQYQAVRDEFIPMGELYRDNPYR